MACDKNADVAARMFPGSTRGREAPRPRTRRFPGADESTSIRCRGRRSRTCQGTDHSRFCDKCGIPSPPFRVRTPVRRRHMQIHLYPPSVAPFSREKRLPLRVWLPQYRPVPGGSRASLKEAVVAAWSKLPVAPEVETLRKGRSGYALHGCTVRPRSLKSNHAK